MTSCEADANLYTFMIPCSNKMTSSVKGLVLEIVSSAVKPARAEAEDSATSFARTSLAGSSWLPVSLYSQIADRKSVV